MLNAASVVEFRWTGSNASGYQVEIGRSSGATDFTTLESAGAATTLTWSGAPVGTFYASVRGRNGSTLGSPSSEVVVASIDARRMIDALVFGFGPLAVAGNAAGPFLPDRMDGWQPGAAFEVVLGESLPAAFASAAESTAQQIAPATRGLVRASVRGRQPDPLPSPRPGEVTISFVSPQAVQEQCDCDRCVGCASTYFLGSFIQRALIKVSSEAQAATIAHELGHAIGLSHIITAAGVRPPFSMGLTTDGQFSSSGRLNVLDPATIRMLETIYGAGLTAGASRRQFEALGFVLPEAQSARAGQARGWPGATVTREGVETVLRRPVCQ